MSEKQEQKCKIFEDGHRFLEKTGSYVRKDGKQLEFLRCKCGKEDLIETTKFKKQGHILNPAPKH